MALRPKRNIASNKLRDALMRNKMRFASYVDMWTKKYMERERSGISSEIEESDSYFKSNYPNWWPYDTTARRPLQRTFVRETVKEITFDDPMDYLNYVIRKKNLPTNLFEQQADPNFVPKLALLPEEYRDDESTLDTTAFHRGSKWMSSRIVSPCNSERTQGDSAIPGFSMFLSDDCYRPSEHTPCNLLPVKNNSCYSQRHRPSKIPVSSLQIQGCSDNSLPLTPCLKHNKFTTKPAMPLTVKRNATVSSKKSTISKEESSSGLNRYMHPSLQSNGETKRGKVLASRNCRNGSLSSTCSSLVGTQSKKTTTFIVPNERLLRSRTAQKSMDCLRNTQKSKLRKEEFNETIVLTRRQNRTSKRTMVETRKLKLSSEVAFKEKVVNRRKPEPSKKSGERRRSSSMKKNEQELSSSPLIVSISSDSVYSKGLGADFTSNRPIFAYSTSSHENDSVNCLPPQITIPSGFWNENVYDVLNSYEETYPETRGKITVLGFHAEELRKAISDEQQTTLSAFLSCVSKQQTANQECFLVDSGLKEDRRAIAAAKCRNRLLTSGYCDWDH